MCVHDLRWFVVVDIGGIVDHQTIFCVFTDLRWFVVVDIGGIVDHWTIFCVFTDLRWVFVDVGDLSGLLLTIGLSFVCSLI